MLIEKTCYEKQEKNNDRIPCLIMHNRRLSMIRKIINKYLTVLQTNPELRETFQNN